jgi:hypothetical protein
MDNVIAQRIAAVVLAYTTEVQWWDVVPDSCRQSIHRLGQFVERNAPVIVIVRELDILTKKITEMQHMRATAERPTRH